MGRITIHDLLELQEEERIAKRALMWQGMNLQLNAKDAAQLKSVRGKYKAENQSIQELYFLLHGYMKSALSAYQASMDEIKNAYMSSSEKGQDAMDRLFGGIIWVNQKMSDKRKNTPSAFYS